jgi:hypothetical protein
LKQAPRKNAIVSSSILRKRQMRNLCEGSDMREDVMNIVTIDRCRRMDPDLRSDLEILDEETRRIVARIYARRMEAGDDETLFSVALSTVLLSIAATLTKTMNHRFGAIDTNDFLERASNAADWANNRHARHGLVPESARMRP